MSARTPRKSTSVTKLDLPYGSKLLPEEIHTIKLKKDEVLVWTLDYEQYKDLSSEDVYKCMKTMQSGLEKLFPKNKVVVTLGKTEITTTTEQPHIDIIV